MSKFQMATNRQIRNMAEGKGCENCGREAIETNVWGMSHCGGKGCKRSLSIVGKSRDTAELLRKGKNLKSKIL